MGAAKASNSKDTYLATAVTFIVIGALYLIDKLIHFSTIGLPWVMNKDNMLLYASICFLIFKRDKSIGFMIESLRQISSQITCADKHNRCIFYTSLHYFFTVLQTRIK